MTEIEAQLTELLRMLREGKAEFYRGPHPDAMMSYIGTAEGMAERLRDEIAEQAREIERLRTAATDLIDDWEAGNDTVNHGIMMAVHGPGGVNSQSTAGEAQE